MQGASEERAEDPAAALMLATVRMIRNWVESSFSSGEAARMERKGQLKARFKVELSPEMWEELQTFVKASFSLSGLQLKRLERGERGEGSCVEVVMSGDARQQYALKNPGVIVKKVVTAETPSDGALEGFRTPAAKLPVHELSTPCKAPSQKEAKRRTAPVDSASPTSKRSRTKEAMKIPSESMPSMPLQDVHAREVSRDLKGLVAAKEGLAAAVSSKDLHEAVAWLKGLGRREVAAEDLAKTRIGLSVNECRKQGDPYMTKLADTLLQRHAVGLLGCHARHGRHDVALFSTLVCGTSRWKKAWRQAQGLKS